MNQRWLQYILAVVLTIILFYVVGRVMSQVVGQQMFAVFETSLERLPLVNKIYGSVPSTAVDAHQQKNRRASAWC